MSAFRPRSLASLAMPVFLLSPGCQHDSEVAREALEQAIASAKGQALSTEIIELGTNFVPGMSVEESLDYLAVWILAQVECAEVSQDQEMIIVDLGTLDNMCDLGGYSYGGIVRLFIMRTTSTEAEVIHNWVGLTDGSTLLDGYANVLWRTSTDVRDVISTVSWTGDDGVMETHDTLFQEEIEPKLGLDGGIWVKGSRVWTSGQQEWLLEASDLEMMGRDPVPRNGLYRVTSPEGKELRMEFAALDDNTVQVTIDDGASQWSARLSKGGEILDFQ